MFRVHSWGVGDCKVSFAKRWAGIFPVWYTCGVNTIEKMRS